MTVRLHREEAEWGQVIWSRVEMREKKTKKHFRLAPPSHSVGGGRWICNRQTEKVREQERERDERQTEKVRKARERKR